ncbi:hypothetical protein ElyMa_001183700 [Elysia marginata]|uniref:Peptidase S1 domain-containing protein n=1 Tax=Elysia marginata TaxID=1093978 RepID=A0AAV4I482_9GAST|nr:hypothetical protein ElyMa_001183700 [Elysia marginata]
MNTACCLTSGLRAVAYDSVSARKPFSVRAMQVATPNLSPFAASARVQPPECKTRRALYNSLEVSGGMAKSTDLSHHECEILEKGLEAAEAALAWERCKKNPGHAEFIPVQEFLASHLPSSLTGGDRARLSMIVDRTVRLRVHCTSRDRPDGDCLSQYRGSDRLRLGTGFIYYMNDPKCNQPCPCRECGGNVAKKFWTFSVITACHVVYNTEEAKETKVDLFYDDENCEQDGRMKTVWAVEVKWAESDNDLCVIFCVTHDEMLGERIRCLIEQWNSGHSQTESEGTSVPSLDFGDKAALVVSHPHGQPKKISVGKISLVTDSCVDEFGCEYLAATCPGSSGAPVIEIRTVDEPRVLPMWGAQVHCGTYVNADSEFGPYFNFSNFLYRPLLTNAC